MRVSDYIASFLASHGVTDAFGIPGGVILDFIYALDAAEGITPHLSYHEQTAGFAACGYAQSSGKLGVAYATRGPGFTNLISPIADAYYDSIPVLFITGHITSVLPIKSRIIEDQEMDTCAMVKNITKYAKRIDSLDELQPALEDAYYLAMSGRKGPVFLDIKASLYKEDINISCINNRFITNSETNLEINSVVKDVNSAIKSSKRPVILAGDGINQCQLGESFNEFVRRAQIPVLSSRYSHNLLENQDFYYGYVGSHGIRYANFILSKADLIITFGNRLCFPSASASYSPIVKNTRIVRFDIDEGEFFKHKEISNKIKLDLKDLMPALLTCTANYGNHLEWIDVCNQIRTSLWNEDRSVVVDQILTIIEALPTDCTIVSDVGNNEFWVSRASVLSKCNYHTLYSKSFGTLGNALGKAIGAYYATGKRSVVFIGDQGLQLNIQELQYVYQNQLPITIVLLDNSSSGMIKDRETATSRPYYLHTTRESGYENPSFEKIVNAYNIKYYIYSNLTKQSMFDILSCSGFAFIHVLVDENSELTPILPKGQPIQDMFPLIDRKLYNELNNL